MSLKIIGTGSALPEKQVSNEELSALLDTSDQWITEKTGIKNRFICTEESLTDLAETAGRAALEKAGLKPSDIDLILCSTISGDYTTPSLACCVSQRLSATCPALDLNAACSGFIYALDAAAAYLNSEKAKNILIISAEMMSKHIDWNDRATCVLFGDGAGACVVTKGTALRYINLTADGEIRPLHLKTGTGNNPFRKINEAQEPFVMEGQEVFKFAVQSIEKEVARALDTLALTAKDIDYFLIHQANQRILDSARIRMKQPDNKFPANIHQTGNISSASIPILLDEMLSEGKIKTGDTLLLTAFGAGLTTGTCVMIWE